LKPDEEVPSKTVEEPMDQDPVQPAVPEASTVATEAASDIIPPVEEVAVPAVAADVVDAPVSAETATPSIDDVVKTNGRSSRAGDVEEGKEVIPEPESPAKAEEQPKITPVAPKLAEAPAISVNSSGQKKPKIDTSSLPTRQYLDQTVVPILLQGLSWLAKTRPTDPISKLSTYLLEHKEEYENGHSPAAGNLDSNLLGGVTN
jgi:protein dpy-30